jgi:hypothetical protein
MSLFGGEVVVLLGAAAALLTAVFGVTRLSRARAVRRFNAAMDTYADGEIDRQRRRAAGRARPSHVGSALPGDDARARGLAQGRRRGRAVSSGLRASGGG